MPSIATVILTAHHVPLASYHHVALAKKMKRLSFNWLSILTQSEAVDSHWVQGSSKVAHPSTRSQGLVQCWCATNFAHRVFKTSSRDCFQGISVCALFLQSRCMKTTGMRISNCMFSRRGDIPLQMLWCHLQRRGIVGSLALPLSEELPVALVLSLFKWFQCARCMIFLAIVKAYANMCLICLLYTSPSPRDS